MPTDQLTSYTENGQTTTYNYFLDGLRRSKTRADGSGEKYVWDGSNLIYYHPNDNSRMGYAAYYGVNGIFASSDWTDYDFADYLYQKNAHGDVTALIDNNGNVNRYYRYDAFGIPDSYSADDTNPFRYAGQYYDRESQSYYLRARYYLPRYGRFTAEDPARDGLNWYTYCADNPVRYYDPSGLDAILITADDSAVHCGHSSVLVQDSDGNWYYYYWGDKNAFLEKVPSSAMKSLDSFNEWLQDDANKEMFRDSTTNYDRANYFEGDFSESVSYYQSLTDKVVVKMTILMPIGNTLIGNMVMHKRDIYLNTKYNLLSNNCVTTSIDGLEKGILSNGKSFSSLDIQREIVPNLYAANVGKVTGNFSFSKSGGAGNDKSTKTHDFWVAFRGARNGCIDYINRMFS